MYILNDRQDDSWNARSIINNRKTAVRYSTFQSYTFIFDTIKILLYLFVLDTAYIYACKGIAKNFLSFSLHVNVQCSSTTTAAPHISDTKIKIGSWLPNKHATIKTSPIS